MDWSKSEVNSIRIALSRGRHNLVERLSNRLGVDERSVRGKVREIELKKRIKKSARGAKEKLKKHRGRRIRKYGGRIRERFQS